VGVVLNAVGPDQVAGGYYSAYNYGYGYGNGEAADSGK
jgi:hypothetical protein